MEGLLFFWQVNLETNNVAILDLTLAERQFGFHEFDHAWFDFLYMHNIKNSQSYKMGSRYLEQFQRSTRRPAHSFINDWSQITNLTCFRHVYLSSAIEGLFRRIKMLKEYHNRLWRGIRLAAN